MSSTPPSEEPDPADSTGKDEWSRLDHEEALTSAQSPTGRVAPSFADIKLAKGWEPIPGYRLERRLGRGGFGEVWQADGPGGVTLALKLIRFDNGLGASEVRAIDLLKNIHHPHLIGISGVWRTDDLLIIAMELADGTLFDALQQARAEGQVGIDPDLLIEYLREASKGIDHLNTLGIVHRDIKPQNLLLMSGGVKVADFGLARLTKPSNEESRLALSPSYAAPELCRGEAGERTDQYSLGITYCQLLGGRLPFEGHHLQVIHGHLEEEPDLSMIPAAERRVVARALSKKPFDRWPDCRSFVSALAMARSSPSAEETSDLDAEVTASWLADPPRIQATRRGFVVAIGSIGLLATAAASAAAWVRLSSRDPLAEIRREEILRDLRFIRRQPLNAIRNYSPNHVEVDLITSTANPSFDILSDERTIDLRGWQDVPDDQLSQLVSSVTQIRNVTLRKLKQADELRFPGRTSGLALFFRCLSHYPFYEVAQQANAFVGNQRMKVREIVIDVSSIHVGEDFTVQIASTYWNSLQTDDELWFGVIGYGTASKVSQLILFPDGKPFKTFELRTTKAVRDKSVRYEGSRTVLSDPDRSWINWDIPRPEEGRVYQIYWTW